MMIMGFVMVRLKEGRNDGLESNQRVYWDISKYFLFTLVV